MVGWVWEGGGELREGYGYTGFEGRDRCRVGLGRGRSGVGKEFGFGKEMEIEDGVGYGGGVWEGGRGLRVKIQ